jgi:hypothetical protein
MAKLGKAACRMTSVLCDVVSWPPSLTETVCRFVSTRSITRVPRAVRNISARRSGYTSQRNTPSWAIDRSYHDCAISDEKIDK